MGEAVAPGLDIAKGTVLATFNRKTGKYENKKSGNQAVIFLGWVSKTTSDISNRGVEINKRTTHYIRVIEQGPNFKPRIREIAYSTRMADFSFFNNAWYYNVVNRR